MSARKELYDFISSKGCGTFTTEELRSVTKVSEWARVLRQLKQDGIISYDHNNSKGIYSIFEINSFQKSTKRTDLSAKLKASIRFRDGYKCQACGKGVSDNVKLHVDHKIPLDWGGTNLEDNLWTLCEDCNLGKKNFFQDDFDPELMKLVNNEKSGYQKLVVLFQKSPNKKFSPTILQGISGIRDWTRTIRLIRNKEGINIVWGKPTEEYPIGYYLNIQ
jgi:5-methylcytosine-specific restriction endonuclease McrA